jgi:hypothetical protein
MERSMPDEAEDRRLEDARWYCKVPVTLESASDPLTVVVGLCLNLSRSGLGLWLSSEVPPGAEVRVRLHLSSNSGIACPGRIAWVRNNILAGIWQAGVVFSELLDGALVAAFSARRPES